MKTNVSCKILCNLFGLIVFNRSLINQIHKVVVYKLFFTNKWFFTNVFTHRFWPTEEANVDVIGHFRVPKDFFSQNGAKCKTVFLKILKLVAWVLFLSMTSHLASLSNTGYNRGNSGMVDCVLFRLLQRVHVVWTLQFAIYALCFYLFFKYIIEDLAH